jgi:hypothetical protein
MFARLNNLLRTVLPVVAVLMLTAGPATAAADAAYRGRMAERAETLRAAQKSIGTLTIALAQPADPPPSSESEKPSKPEAGGAAAYLVPAVAKPAEAKSTDYLAACATQHSAPRAAGRRTPFFIRPSEPLQDQLHRPAYLAQAPPVC